MATPFRLGAAQFKYTPVFETLADAAAAGFSAADYANMPSPMRVRVTRYDSNSPAAEADYIEVESEPTHGLKFQADGVWFEIDEREIDARMAGCVCDGATDDTAAFQRLVTALDALNAVGIIPTGETLISSTITRPGANGFGLVGFGRKSRLKFRLLSDSTALSFSGGSDLYFGRFHIDGGYSVTGFGASGLSITNPIRCIAEQVTVSDYRGTGILFSGNSAHEGYDSRMIDCEADGNGHGQNGLSIARCDRSFIINGTAIDLDLAGTPSYGLQLKDICEGSHIVGGYAEDCIAGVVFATDDSGTGTGPSNCTARGVVTKDCQYGGLARGTTNAFMQVQADMTSSPSGGYALAVNSDNEYFQGEVTPIGVQSGRTAVRVNSSYTTVRIPHANGYGTTLLVLESGVQQVSVFVGGIFPSVSNLNGLITDSSGQTNNAVYYTKDAPGGALNTTASVDLRTVGKPNNWMVYDGTADEFTWRANDTDLFQLAAAQMRPVADNAMSLGTSLKRFSNVYGRRIRPGDGTPIWMADTGAPEGVVSAVRGSLFLRTDGGTGTTLYVKETGSGTTGWVAK